MLLPRISIDRPVFMCMVQAFLIVLGFIGFVRIGVDLMPDIEPPIITITTQYPGAGPNEIESLVSKKIEDSVSELGGIENLTSISKEGLSQVVIEFALEMNAREQLIEVRDKVSRIRSTLPDEIEEPLVERIDFDARPILKLALMSLETKTSEISASPINSAGDQNFKPLIPESKLRIYGKEVVKPLIQQIDGVGQVTIFGGVEREVVIDLNRQKMLLWKMTPSIIAAAIKSSNANIPAGEIKEEPRRRALRLLGEYQNIAEIKDTIIKTLPGGRAITVGDVGIVRDTFKDRDSFARVNQKPVVMLEVKKTSGANTVEVADKVLKKLKPLNNTLPQGIKMESIYDGAKQVRMNLDDVMESMVIAAILAIFVVYFFLTSLQSTFITGIALPMTLINSVFGLYMAGGTLNTMTLLGLTLAVGILLDDAIVVRESIWRKIEEGHAPKEAAYLGTKEVFTAVIATSLVILATFLPVTLIPGIVGKFLAAFAITVCLTILFSTFDALTMAPMLSAYLVSKKDKKESSENLSIWGYVARPLKRFEAWSNKTTDRMTVIYETMLRWSLERPAKVLLMAVGVFILSLFMAKLVGFTFQPPSEFGELDISAETPSGSSINKTNQVISEIEKEVQKDKDVELTAARVGSDLGDMNIGTVYVKLVPSSERKKTTADFKEQFRRMFASLSKQENTPLVIKDAGGGPSHKAISVAVQGSDNDILAGLSSKILAKTPEAIPEIVDLTSNMKPGRKELQFHIDRVRSTAFGLMPRDVGTTIRGLFEGDLAGQYREEGQEFDIRVRLQPEDRLGISSLENLTIPNDRGEAIPLSAVAKQQDGTSPTKVTRINRQRSVLFEGDLARGAALGTVIEKLNNLIKPLLPANYRLDFKGQAKTLGELGFGIQIALGLSTLFIFMIMASLYESLVLPFAILLTLPMSVIGVFGALLITGRMMDIYASIGIILLVGLVTKNAILLLDHVEHLRKEGKSQKDALLAGGLRRLRPILMTSFCMIAGMLPIAIGWGELNKSRAAMGTATIGGLVSSTFLSLIVVPCAYIYLDNLRSWLKRKILN